MLRTPYHLCETDLVDLHTHSHANDGAWRPATLARAAAAAGIRVLALTDHDTLAGVADLAGEAAAVGIYAIPGIEVSSRWENAIYHVLLYDFDPRHPALAGLLADLWQEVVAVAARGRDELRGRGYPLPDLERLAGDQAPLPFHVLLAALHAGMAADFQGVVQLLVGEMGLSFAAGADMAAVVGAAHAAGGVAILAHPGRTEYGFTPADPATIARMAEATGLDGIEVYHWSHGPAEVATFGRLAAERGLLVSCGSDSHGPNSLRRLHGWEARLCRDLLRRFGFVVGAADRARAEGSR